MKTKKSNEKQGKTSGFDYSAMKNVANEHEREGRWTEAAQVWTEVVEQSANKMIIDNARRRAKNALANAAADDTQATHHVAAGRDGEPVEVTVPGRESDARAADDGATHAPDDEPSTAASSPANDAPASDPGASAAQPDATAPAKRDLPPVGTMIQKRDRKGELRCECKVVDGGIEYRGTIYKSLSSAALAASKDLGLGASTLDGWAWWGLKTRPAAPGASKKDVVASLARAFAKYREKADAIVKAATGDDTTKVLSAIRSQGAALLAMVEPAETAQ